MSCTIGSGHTHIKKIKVGDLKVLFERVNKHIRVREQLGVVQLVMCEDCKFKWFEVWFSPSK